MVDSYNSKCLKYIHLNYNYFFFWRKDNGGFTALFDHGEPDACTAGIVRTAENTGLTIGQPKVLDYLKDHDGSSQKEIARNCFLEAGSLTSILNRMEEKGLIERRMLNGNRRTFHIYLTKEGWKSQKLVEESFLEIEKQALKGITEEEFDAYLTFSRKIFKNLMLTEEEGTKNE